MKSTSNPFLRISTPALLTAAVFGITTAAQAATISWGTATNLTGASDVFNVGSFNYGYTESNQAATVNGVTFAAGNSPTSLGSGNVTMTGFQNVDTVSYNDNEFSGAYGTLITGAAWNYDGGNPVNATVSLNNLSSGHIYATQFWVADYRSFVNNRTETLDGSVTLNYLNTGKGQYAIGRFTADAATQTINIAANESAQMNAIQLRDITGVWNGAASTNLNNSEANFNGGSYTTMSGLGVPVTSLFFADTDGFGNSMAAKNNITVDAAGFSAGSLNFQNSSLNYTLQNASGSTGITGATALTKSGSGTLTLSSANTYTGGTAINGGTVQLANANAVQSSSVSVNVNNGLAFSGGIGTFNVGALAGAGNILLTDLASSAVNLSVGDNDASTTYSGTLSGGGSLTKTGAGTLTLSGVNSYSGGTTVNEGTLKLELGGRAGTETLGSFVVVGGATLNLDNTNTTVGGYYPTNVVISGAGAVTKTGVGSIDLWVGTTSLTGFTGTMDVQQGALRLNGIYNNGNMGQATLNIANGATFDLRAASNLSVDKLTGSGTLDQSYNSGPGLSVTVGSNNGSSTFDGVIQNSSGQAMSLTKAGSGTLTLTGTNSYDGATNVNVGKLVINGDNSGATGAVTVANGATLGGIGTVGGATTISGTHTPGNSPGVQSFSSDLSYAATSIFEWDLASSATGTRGTQYDGVNVGGTLSGTSGAVFKVVLGSGAFTETFWNTNQSWTDIFKANVDGSGSPMDIASVFSAIQWFEGTTNMTSLTGTEGSFTISGSTLNWTAVPEPTSALAGLLLTAGLLRRRR
jgi:autotransporter-associated beta strand protein